MKPLSFSWALAVPALLACGGCAERLFQTAPYAAAPPAKKTAGPHAKPDAAANVALDRLARAALEWSKKPAPGAAKHAAPVVYIDTEAVARRLPQWKLADALDRSGTGASFTWNESFAGRPIAGLPRGAGGASEGGASPGSSSTPGAVPVRLAAGTATADALPGLEDTARLRQNNAFTEFLRDAARAQRETRFDRAEIMRATLEDEVEAARKAPLDELTPVQLNEAMQLELSNLRLKLLTTPAAQKEAVRAEIASVEASWQQRLRDQETERLAELSRLRRERPLQVRRAGEDAIRAALQQGRSTDEALRTQLRNDHTALVNEGFSDPALVIGLPAANLSARFSAPPQLAGGKALYLKNSLPVNSFKTSLPVLPSYGAGAGLVRTNGNLSGTANRSANLRLAARTEASALAQGIARRKGWKLVQPGKSQGVYRDETATALGLLPAL